MQVKLPQLAEISYIEYGYADDNGKGVDTFLQVFIRDGPSPSCVQHRELTEGRIGLSPDEFHKTCGKFAITDTFILCGRFESLTFRAVGALCQLWHIWPGNIADATFTTAGSLRAPVPAGSFVADPDPSQMQAVPALPAGVHDLRAQPALLDSALGQTYVSSPDLLPLAALPQAFQEALAPLADYWHVVGMAMGGAWPDCLDSYILQDTFGELVSHAGDLVSILLEDSLQCPATPAALDRVRSRLRAGASEAAVAAGDTSPMVCLSALLSLTNNARHPELLHNSLRVTANNHICL